MTGLVSVVVPCFNYGRYLRDCVESLKAQSYASWECIIVDDGSRDDTPATCAELVRADPRVKFARQENRGVSAARNLGLSRISGEFVQFLDADDLLEPLKLATQVAFLESNPGVDIVLGEAAFFDDATPRQLRKWRREGATGQTRGGGATAWLPLAELVEGNICVTHAALLRRRVIEAAGGFDEGLATHEDWDFWFRCALAGCRFGLVSEGNNRALVREHGGSLSRDREPMLRSAIAVRQRARGRLPASLERVNDEHIAGLKCRLGVELIRAGRSGEGWALYREGLRGAQKKATALAHLLLVLPGAGSAARLGRRAVARLFPA
jgi:glycosyltransferase involved in cell wall biosynthesis